MAKDRTKYDLFLIKENEKICSNISKTNLPMLVFKYLIENNLLTNVHMKTFSKNHFGRTWKSNMGDLLINNPKDEIRYKSFTANGTTYYASSQWQIDTITKFINYVNKEFSDYIEIKEYTPIDLSDLFTET